MANQSNIQLLFRRIAAAQVIEYLRLHGWQRLSDDTPHTALFAKHWEDQETPTELQFFASESEPEFRQKLPDIVFRLCVMEERPALDIANEMYALGKVVAPLSSPITLPGESPSPTVAGDARFTLHHGRGERLTLHLKSRQEAYSLDPDDRLTVVYRPEDAGAIEVSIEEMELVIDVPAAIPLRLFQTAARGTASLRDVVDRELAALHGPDGSVLSETAIANLEEVMRRMEFELDAGDRPAAGDPILYRRQASILAVTLAKALPYSRLAHLALWRVILRVCERAGLGLELYASAPDDLAMIAAADDPLAPTNTLAWLKEHALAPETASL